MDLESFVQAARRIPAIVVGTLDGDTSEFGALGTVAGQAGPASRTWEIGSITKVFTGILLAEMSLRGEVGLDDPIGSHVPDDVAARMPDLDRQPTLADLASHTAGLPRVPRAWMKRLKGHDDPYSMLTETDVWEILGADTVRPRKRRSRYSNYGAGLLGHILARVAGTDYPSLITDRVLRPLGMTATDAGGSIEVVQGYRKGKPTPPWTFGALAGAGAIRSTALDMLRFAGACIDPPAGTLGEAMDLARRPVYFGRIQRVGLGWMMRAMPGRKSDTTTWHNGGTFGGSSFLAIDTDQRIAVVSFGNRGPRLASPLDAASWKLFDNLMPNQP